MVVEIYFIPLHRTTSNFNLYLSFSQFLPDGVHRHGIIRTAVSHIIIVIDHRYFPHRELLLLLHTFVVFGYEILKKPSQAPFVVIGRLLAVF